MSANYGEKSFSDFTKQAEAQLKAAARVEPTVVVSDANWKAMISSQASVIEVMRQIKDEQRTLITCKEMEDYLSWQIQILTESTTALKEELESCRREYSQMLEEFRSRLKDETKKLTSQVGSMNDRYSYNMDQQLERQRRSAVRQFLIGLLPTILLAVAYFLQWRL